LLILLVNHGTYYASKSSGKVYDEERSFFQGFVIVTVAVKINIGSAVIAAWRMYACFDRIE